MIISVPLFIVEVLYLQEYFVFFLGIFSLLNLLFILFAYLWTLKRKFCYDSYTPGVSIIIPCFNEENTIARCIDMVYSINYDKEKLDIICVDDGSTDTTAEIVKQKIKKYPSLRLIRIKHSGKSPALNSALAKSKYDIILSLDADMIIDKNYLKNIVAPLKKEEVGYSFGIVKIMPTTKHSLMEYYQTLEFLYMNLVRFSTSLFFSFPIWFSGPCACYKKSAVLKTGGFGSDTLTEDFDISLKLFKYGYKCAFVKNAVAYTIPMTTANNLTKQRMRWFYGSIQNLNKHKSLIKTGSVAMVYIFSSYLLWFFNSLLIFPQSIRTYISNSFSVKGILTLIDNNTFLGTFKFVGEIFNRSFLNVPYLIYGTIGVLLFILYVLSIVAIDKKISFRMTIAVFTYFFYLTYLQGCFLLSFVYYPVTGIKSFNRK